MTPEVLVAVLAVVVPAVLVGTGAWAVRRGRRPGGLGGLLVAVGLLLAVGGLLAAFALVFVYTALH